MDNAVFDGWSREELMDELHPLVVRLGAAYGKLDINVSLKPSCWGVLRSLVRWWVEYGCRVPPEQLAQIVRRSLLGDLGRIERGVRVEILSYCQEGKLLSDRERKLIDSCNFYADVDGMIFRNLTQSEPLLAFYRLAPAAWFYRRARAGSVAERFIMQGEVDEEFFRVFEQLPNDRRKDFLMACRVALTVPEALAMCREEGFSAEYVETVCSLFSPQVDLEPLYWNLPGLDPEAPDAIVNRLESLVGSPAFWQAVGDFFQSDSRLVRQEGALAVLAGVVGWLLVPRLGFWWLDERQRGLAALLTVVGDTDDLASRDECLLSERAIHEVLSQPLFGPMRQLPVGPYAAVLVYLDRNRDLLDGQDGTEHGCSWLYSRLYRRASRKHESFLRSQGGIMLE